MTLRKIWSLAGYVIGALALVMQFYLTMEARLAKGDGVIGGVFFYFTFLTILTNLQLVLTYLSEVWQAGWLAWWRKPATRAFSAGLITLVGVYYHIYLSGLESPTGLDGVLNFYLHYVSPVLFVLWWLVTEPHGRVTFRNIPAMLLPLAGYLVLVFTRGAIVNEYPYPAMDIGTLGVPQVAINMALIGVFLVVIFAAVVGIDRLLGRRSSAG
jgi:hypothetical protein